MSDTIYRPKLAITTGDINGIGLETIIKVLSDESITEHFTPVIYGSPKTVSYHKNIVKNVTLRYTTISDGSQIRPGRINVVNCWDEVAPIRLGQITEEGGKYAYISLDRAIQDLKEGHVDALVTAPIHKKSMQLAGFEYSGHTDYLKARFNVPHAIMIMMDEYMKVASLTGHIPLKAVSSSLTKELLLQILQTLYNTLRIDFDIDKPTISVLGLNPHAGEDGLLGTEENDFIKPAIIELKKKGLLVYGPFPADSYFGNFTQKKYHLTVGMYHDQVLIPFKTLAFHRGVQFTAGLPIVRTSPDHGPGFDIAGKNVADPTSMRHAMFAAVDAFRNRKAYHENRSNPKPPKEALEKALHAQLPPQPELDDEADDSQNPDASVLPEE